MLIALHVHTDPLHCQFNQGGYEAELCTRTGPSPSSTLAAAQGVLEGSGKCSSSLSLLTSPTAINTITTKRVVVVSGFKSPYPIVEIVTWDYWLGRILDFLLFRHYKSIQIFIFIIPIISWPFFKSNSLQFLIVSQFWIEHLSWNSISGFDTGTHHKSVQYRE